VDPSVIPDVGVRLTTAHYTTPSRKKIHGVGIEPDVVARLTRGEEEAIFQKRSPGLKKNQDPETEVNDEPLDRAIDLLRGWKVVKRRLTPDRSS
jgi:C-terminal processing protease CtpA/Prc